MTSMDEGGLLHLLDLHRRAELMGLCVLVVGWQPQPQQLMAGVAGIPWPGTATATATGERFALAGFRRLIEQRAQRARDLSDFTAGWLPQPWRAPPRTPSSPRAATHRHALGGLAPTTGVHSPISSPSQVTTAAASVRVTAEAGHRPMLSPGK
ncbi:hypothetical protein ACFV7Q_11035 [Streptomyces sp. NPDC059851]|uniref:hypothetical protein n=1 Tax=Streptomyces sp. NPDC059851 TaxID=3346971 RepID=UPI003661CEBC